MRVRAPGDGGVEGAALACSEEAPLPGRSACRAVPDRSAAPNTRLACFCPLCCPAVDLMEEVVSEDEGQGGGSGKGKGKGKQGQQQGQQGKGGRKRKQQQSPAAAAAGGT